MYISIQQLSVTHTSRTPNPNNSSHNVWDHLQQNPTNCHFYNFNIDVDGIKAAIFSSTGFWNDDVRDYLHEIKSELVLSDPVKLRQLKAVRFLNIISFAKYSTHHRTFRLITGYQQKR